MSNSSFERGVAIAAPRFAWSMAYVLGASMVLMAQASAAQQRPMRPEDTERWTPVPKVVAPGRTDAAPPSDAIVLFNGRNLDEWTSMEGAPAGWTVQHGVVTVNKRAGSIKTKRTFSSYQMHIEWRIPKNVTGSGQLRGNSGVFLAIAPDIGYEIQIMDSYNNATYVNGQAASVYKQTAPLVNAMRKPGEWQTYDIIWTAPTFNENGTLNSPARVTAFHNGVLVLNDWVLKGGTPNTGLPEYKPHGAAPIMLQAHDDPSPPISFRNIWVRPL